MAPEVCSSFTLLRKQRAQGKPDADCTRGRAHKSARVDHRFNRIIPAFPARMAYGLLRALPGDRLVKHFQTIHQCGVDVTRGLVLLFGIGTWALPSWDPRTRRNNLLDDLAVSVTAGPSRHTNSPHPSSRKGHLSTALWSSGFLLSGLILNCFHAAVAAACSRVHRNSVPSTQMRCIITASRRARATIAFFIPRRLAICMAHALSQDHFFECIML